MAVSLLGCGDASDPVILGADRNTEAKNTLEISPSEISLLEGESIQLKATVTGPFAATFVASRVNWSVDNPNVASITSSGIVTADRHGEMEIRATYENLSASAPGRVQGIPRIMEPVTDRELTGAVGRQLAEMV